MTRFIMMRFFDTATVVSRCRRLALAGVLGLTAAAGWAQSSAISQNQSSDRKVTPASQRLEQLRQLQSSQTSRTGAGRTATATRTAPRSAAPNPAADARKRTVVRRQPTKASRGGGGATAAALPEISVLPGMEDNALYFNPPQLECEVGDRFSERLEFYNSQSAAVDSLDIWIHYDPATLEPTWIDTAPIAERLAEPLKPLVWKQEGYIQLKAKLKEPSSQAVQPIVELYWRSLAASPATRIELAAPPDRRLEVMANGKNLVETTGIGNRGRVSALIVVGKGDSRQLGLRMAAAAMGAEGTEESAEERMEPLKRVRLAILAPKFVESGQVATADVVLVNPEGLSMDTVKFRIRYDTRMVEVLDADQNNYITHGLNIFDGDFHDRFPFDYQGADNVDPAAGVIRYEMGSVSGSVPYSSGTVARIVFRMLRPAGGSAFWFDRADPVLGTVASDVSDGGVSLLGRTDKVASQALNGARFQVAPLDLSRR